MKMTVDFLNILDPSQRVASLRQLGGSPSKALAEDNIEGREQAGGEAPSICIGISQSVGTYDVRQYVVFVGNHYKCVIIHDVYISAYILLHPGHITELEQVLSAHDPFQF